jgi:hypothetical protein
MPISFGEGGPYLSEGDADDPLSRERTGTICRQTHENFLAQHHLTEWGLKITHIHKDRISVTSTLPKKQKVITREFAVTPTLADDLRSALEQDFLEWQTSEEP